MIIYKITNLVNSKIYIGMTKYQLDKRIAAHIKTKSHIGNSLKKYGKEKFYCEIIDRAETNDQLCEKEKYWIKFYDCKSPKGYNLTDGGDGLINPSKRTLKKMSKTSKQIWADPERRKKMSKTLKQIWADPEQREKQSKITEKQWADPVMRQRHITAITSPEYREKQSEIVKKKWSNPEYKEKFKRRMKVVLNNPKIKKNQSEAAKKKWSDPEYKKKTSEAIRNGMSDPEFRKKRSEIARRVLSDPKVLKKISMALKGENHPFFGKHHTEETKEKIRRSLKERYSQGGR